MGNIIVFLEHSESALRSSALSAVNAGRQLAQHHGGQVVGLLVGGSVAAAAAEAKKYVPTVITVEDGKLKDFLAETYAPIVARIAKEQQASAVVGTASNLGKDLFPRVCALLDAGMASDVSVIVSKNQFKRPVLAGNAIATAEVSGEPIVVTARQSMFVAAEPAGSEGTVTSAPAGEINSLGAEFVSLAASKSERPELSDAKIVVSGGRGMKSGDNFRFIEQLADTMNAAVGASRAATDAGFAPADWQVGQTGKVVAPDLYWAVAISGAIQHLAGMKGSKTIVAVNKDPEAPIFQVADYGLVATWEQAIPQLVDAIKKHRSEAH
jgi:electron transfer flavoprotein alpha subunit